MEDDGIILYTVAADDVVSIGVSQILVASNGNFIKEDLNIPMVTANPGNTATDVLSTITIGVNTYSIPNHSNEINSLNTKKNHLSSSFSN